MKTTSITIPTMYGDHHVLEVRKILLAIPGVKEVYASSNFGVVEVSYDPSVTNDLEIHLKLDAAGYLGEWTMPIEFPTPSSKSTFTRHTEVFETSRNVVSFAQKVSFSGRPLWPCPGMGAISHKQEE